MKISAEYCRVSSLKQEKQETIGSQVMEVEERIRNDGNILGTNLKFIDDGWTGMVLERPGLDAMRDAAKNKEFEVLYVYDLGRLSRDFFYQLLIEEEFKKLGIKIISLHDINGEGDDQEFARNVMGLSHDLMRKIILETFRRGKLGKARRGKVVLGPGPYGYVYKNKTKDTEGYLEIDQYEAEVVKKIFNWIGNEQLTIRKVIKRLYDLKIYPRKSKCGHWGNSTLCRLLRNETYIGTTYYNKGQAVEPKKFDNSEKYKRNKRSSRVKRPKEDWIPIPVPVIINKGLFYRTQEQLKINALHSPRNKKHDYLLSGLIYCDCGNRMGCEGGDRNYYYRCQNRLKRYPLPQDCFGPGINTGRIDGVVWQKIQELFKNPDLLKQQAERWLAKKETNYERSETEEIKKALEKIDGEEKRQAKAYGEGIVSFSLFKKMIEDIKSRRETLEGALQEVTDKENQARLTPRLTVEQVVKAIPFIVEHFVQEDKRVLLQKVVKRIEVNNARNYAKIIGYVPINFDKKEVELNAYYRNSWIAECGEIHSF